MRALPNAVLGLVDQRGNNSPLNGRDLTEAFLAEGLWDGREPLPGKWTPDSTIGNTSAGYLLARPKIFGLEALLVRAVHRGEKLEELEITLADAGSYFGYFAEKLPEGLSKKEAQAEFRRRLTVRQGRFAELFEDHQETLKEALESKASRSRTVTRGRTRALRAELTEYHVDALSLRLLTAPNRLLRLSIRRKGKLPKSWLDLSQAEVSESNRLRSLRENIIKKERGDVALKGVPIVPQGYRPYCGLNTLTMVARYLSLHLDEDWLAVAGKFQNTGSAAGSDMLGLYGAVAKEAGLSLQRSREYQQSEIRRSLSSGLPVIVWRRWDRARDRLHSLVAREFEVGKSSSFPELKLSELPSKKKGSPIHASVIIGYNEERKEVLFLESWGGLTHPRRMPIKEMAATSDVVFYFQP